jgi:hypothetical protein
MASLFLTFHHPTFFSVFFFCRPSHRATDGMGIGWGATDISTSRLRVDFGIAFKRFTELGFTEAAESAPEFPAV